MLVPGRVARFGARAFGEFLVCRIAEEADHCAFCTDALGSSVVTGCHPPLAAMPTLLKFRETRNDKPAEANQGGLSCSADLSSELRDAD